MGNTTSTWDLEYSILSRGVRSPMHYLWVVSPGCTNNRKWKEDIGRECIK